jgi:hypothetical protein
VALGTTATPRRSLACSGPSATGSGSGSLSSRRTPRRGWRSWATRTHGRASSPATTSRCTRRSGSSSPSSRPSAAATAARRAPAVLAAPAVPAAAPRPPPPRRGRRSGRGPSARPSPCPARTTQSGTTGSSTRTAWTRSRHSPSPSARGRTRACRPPTASPSAAAGSSPATPSRGPRSWGTPPRRRDAVALHAGVAQLRRGRRRRRRLRQRPDGARGPQRVRRRRVPVVAGGKAGGWVPRGSLQSIPPPHA